MIMANSYDDEEKLHELLKRLIHDIRSPLAGLRMLLYALSGRLSEEEKQALDKMYERVGGVVDSAAGELQKKELHASSLNLHILIQDMLLEKKVEYMGYDVKFIYSTPENHSDINIIGVKDDFCRMLSNLMNNAVEACSNKAGTIRIGLHKSSHAITLSINDDGRGMPTEVLEKLRNGEAITYAKKDGHGDGMGQIRDAIAKLNGTLDIKSMLGQGSNFVINF